MKLSQNLRDRLKKQCEIGNMTMESALQRREEIFQTPKDELVEKLVNKLVEDGIISDKSIETPFDI